MHLLPGDPAIAILGEHATAEALEAIREKLGLNRPLLMQYTSFLGNLVQGDLGKSLSNSKPVSLLILRMLPYSIELSMSAILISIIMGIPIGIHYIELKGRDAETQEKISVRFHSKKDIGDQKKGRQGK